MEQDLRTPGDATWADIHEAEFINRLVDEKIIDKRRLDEADFIIMGELISRCRNAIGQSVRNRKAGQPKDEWENHAAKKIRALLGYREPQDPNKIEQAKETTIKLIRYMADKTGLKFTGAIICGTRIDRNKRPTINSDLDVCLYINQITYGIWPGDSQKIIKEFNSPYEFDLRWVYGVDDFQSDIIGQGIPHWGWNPNGFVVVGEMKIEGRMMPDDKATDFLRNKLSSPEANKLRQAEIKEAERIIEEMVRDWH